jgi:hypothetical protein
MNEVNAQNTNDTKPKKRLYRKLRPDLALGRALRDAQAATERNADPAQCGLIQTRLNILAQQVRNESKEKLQRALAERDALMRDNERLKAELSQALAQLEERRVPVIANETLEQRTDRLLRQFDGPVKTLDAGTF